MSCSLRPVRTDDARVDLVLRLAQQAGKMALELFEAAQVSWKADGSMVTSADLEIETWLEKEISGAFPADGILGEEGFDSTLRRLDAEFAWVLDPLDGTANFGRGLPGFCVSLGILREGFPFAGAVYDPVTDHLFWACAGEGAWLNGRKLHVEAAAPSGRSLFSIRAPFEGTVPAAAAAWLCRYRLRRFGSTALQLCYVALGALAFVHDQGAALWDIAGAAPVVIEAGGVLTTPDGSPLFPIRPAACPSRKIALLAGDHAAHAQALRDLRGAMVASP